jgi:cytochrome c
MTKSILLCLSLTLMASPALAATSAAHATPAEAKEMLRKAVAYYEANGRDKALADFNQKKPPFSDRDLYVFCIGPDHKLVADGEFHQFVGQSADMIKDSSGKSVGEAGWEVANKNGEGELHYSWLNPQSQLIEPKVSYFAKAGGDVCGVGTYDPK